MIWKNRFQERINELWEQAKDRDYKITQTEFSKRFGVTRNAFLGWLRGTGQPDADGFVRIACSENVSLAWLLGDDRPQSEEDLCREEIELLSIYRCLSCEHREDLLMIAKQFHSHNVHRHVAEGRSPYLSGLQDKNSQT